MIELKNVERSYKTGHTETWVLRRIGLTIKEGEFVTVMGPSGAGKSSLLNVLALLDDSWIGEYWFDETPAHKRNRKQRPHRARPGPCSFAPPCRSTHRHRALLPGTRDYESLIRAQSGRHNHSPGHSR